MASDLQIDLSSVDTSADKRLGELMLFVAHESRDDPRFGAVKLNKLLFFIDVMGFLERGRTVSKAHFMRLNEGPVPRRLVPVRESLIAAGRAKIEKVPMPAGLNPQERLVATSAPDRDVFDEGELGIAEAQVRKFWEWNGKQLSALTHKLPAWQIAADQESIPIAAVLLKDFKPSEGARARALQTAEELGIE